MADDGDGKIDPKAQHELNLMTEAMRDCKIKKAGQGDLTCLMERCDGTPFVVRLSSGGKGVLAKQVLRTFCKQHVKRCPDDDWWANEKDCALLQADDMMGDADWALDPNSSANDDGRKQGHFLVRRAGQTTSFAALARQLSKARDADDEKPAAEKIAATAKHFDDDAEKYMQLTRNVDQLAASGSSYGARCAHFLGRPRDLLFDRCRAASSTMRLLDLGSGCGRDAAKLAARGVERCPAGCEVRVVGADAAPRNVELGRAAARLLRVDSRCDFLVHEAVGGDWAALRVDGAPFDGAMAAQVLRYVPWSEHRTVYARLRDHLAPKSGCFVLGEATNDETKEPRTVDGAHTEFRTWPDYRKNVEKAGFAFESKEDYDIDGAPYWVAVFRRKPKARPRPKPAGGGVAGLP